jgi:imidazoleglycerol phosphate dehydratase HisB
MVEQLGRHASFDLVLHARGDLHVDAHHTVEDVGIVLGGCLAEALGDKRGIRRFASMLLPLDEALVEVALDLSGRPSWPTGSSSPPTRLAWARRPSTLSWPRSSGAPSPRRGT